MDKVIQTFRAQELLSFRLGSCKKSTAVMLDKSGAARKKGRQLYSDPSFGIAHHVGTRG